MLASCDFHTEFVTGVDFDLFMPNQVWQNVCCLYIYILYTDICYNMVTLYTGPEHTTGHVEDLMLSEFFCSILS
jgi:hypothetical protein